MCVSLFQQNEFAKRAKVTVLVALALLFAVESVWTSSRRFLYPPPPLGPARKDWMAVREVEPPSFAPTWCVLPSGIYTISCSFSSTDITNAKTSQILILPQLNGEHLP